MNTWMIGKNSMKLHYLKRNADLYVQSKTLLLAEVFNTFWNICFEIYEVDPVHFFLHKD